jgi:hypothetical protein
MLSFTAGRPNKPQETRKEFDQMTQSQKWIYRSIGGVTALAVLLGAAFLFTQVGSADPVREQTSFAAQDRPGFSILAHPPFGDHDEALAEVLGISVDELQDAYAVASDAALQAALEQGILSEEQVERFAGSERFGGFAGRGFPAGGEFNSYLAEALGISTAELESAQQEASEAIVSQALAEGKLTQEQADRMQAQRMVQPYLQDAMQGAYQSAIEQALTDGAITQAQADLLQEGLGSLPGNPGGFFDGRGMRWPH